MAIKKSPNSRIFINNQPPELSKDFQLASTSHRHESINTLARKSAMIGGYRIQGLEVSPRDGWKIS